MGQRVCERRVQWWPWLLVALMALVARVAAQGPEGHREEGGGPEPGLVWEKLVAHPAPLARRGLAFHPLRPDTSWSYAAMAVGSLHVAGLRSDRVAGATVALVVADVAAYAHFHKVWWDHPRTHFHLYRGWRRSKGAYDLGLHDSLWYHLDKCGHIFSASQLSRCGAATARWVGLPAPQADWAGFVLASLLMLEIEVYDGFFAEWGFSVGDFLANELGAALPLLQRRYAPWRRMAFKLSYHPSGDPVHGRYVVEDYAGMTFWLCLDAHLFLPTAVRRFWPDLLDVAIGYGVTAKTGGKRELYLALDLDLRRVQVRNGVLRGLVAAMDAVHLPAPALRVTPSTVGYLIYF